MDCAYSENVSKKERCPGCGAVLVDGMCRKCDYKKQVLKSVCPLCGRAIKDGVCKKCGYRYKESKKSVPIAMNL